MSEHKAARKGKRPTRDAVADAGAVLPGIEVWMHAYVEAALDGIIIFGAGGAVEYCNPATERIFGRAREGILGRDVGTLVHLDGDRTAAAAAGTPFPAPARPGIGQAVAYGVDGRAFPVEISVSQFCIDGRALYAGIVHDISKLRESQQEEARLLRDLDKRNLEITCLYKVEESIRARGDMPGIFEDVARHMQKAFLYPEITTARISFDGEVYVAAPFEVTSWRLASDIRVNGQWRGMVEVFYLEERSPLECGPFLKEEQNLIEAIAGTLGETVERREAEAKVLQASKLASIGELAAGVSHEINNPVNGIINCADILLQRLDSSSRERQFVELIRAEAERIARIVRNLLTFSRQDREQLSLVEPCDIVETVLSLCRQKLQNSHVNLRVDVPQDLPLLRCRVEQMQQVLMNLIINALHALDERYPEAHPNKILVIAARALKRGRGGVLRTTVTDHGCGIAPENMERLFDPFFTTKGRDKGTGLGLSVSDGIVREHGGSISARSEPGRLSIFQVDLPLPEDAAGALEQPSGGG